MLGLCVLLIDVSMVAYMWAWEVQVEGFWQTLTLLFASFWIVDILANFSTGYAVDGGVEMNPLTVAKRYVRTWFFLDLSCVLCDWTTLVVDFTSNTDSNRIITTALVAKVLKVAGMLRIFRVARVAVENRWIVRDQRVGAHILGLLCVVLWTNHLICCAFFGMGRLQHSDTGSTWLTEMLFRSDADRASFYTYSSAFHWSIAQVTLGSCEIAATNSVERVANIFMLLVGTVVSSTLTSSLSAAMIKIGLKRRERTKHMSDLRKYLRQNHIEARLAQRVEQQVRHRLRLKDHVADADVPALNIMSISLRQELHYATCERHLNTHPLFRLWSNLSVATAKTLCSEACNVVHFQSSDDMFHAGTETTEAYYIVQGGVNFFGQPEKMALSTGVGAGSWLSEAALWMHWIHVGTAITETDSTCLAVDADGVIASLRHRDVKEVVAAYAKLFYKRTLQAVPPLDFPTDCQVPATDFRSIVVDMPHEVRKLVGLVAIKQASTLKMFFKPWDLNKLKAEVISGQSVVLLAASGELERIAPVMCVSILRDDGSFLVQIAKWTNSQFVASGLLPGSKMLRGEAKESAVERILKTKVSFVAHHVSINHMESSTAQATSSTTKVPTTYLRTVCHASLRPSFAWVTCDVILPHLVESFPLDVVAEQRNVYLVKGTDSGSVLLHTWLHEHQFEWLKSPAGRDEMQGWVSSLKLEDTTEFCEGGSFVV